jgi:predicted dehydrogenase
VPAQLSAVLVGAGRVGMGPAVEGYEYATHGQVLADHPAFDWRAVVDPLLDEAPAVPIVARGVGDLPPSFTADVAVIATPPGARREVLAALPDVKAVLVEKPLGTSHDDALAFADECRARGLVVQVNLWRRADAVSRALAAGELRAAAGRPQAVFGVYGNGLANNGVHMVDFLRMLFGEIRSVRALADARAVPGGPLAGDDSVAFSATLPDGLTATVAPLDFARYREIALDVWGEEGRVQIVQEGLAVLAHPLREHRALPDEREVASDEVRTLEPTAGRALYEMYSNLADALLNGAEPWSGLDSALRAEAVVDAVRRSAAAGGAAIEP